MRTVRKSLLPAICTIMVLLWLGSGCGEKNNGTNGTESDCTRAANLVAQANDSLANQMDVVINQTLENADSSFRPRDIDFTGVYNLYNEAVALCPTNLDAQFGAGFTGLLLYLADPELNDLIDRIKYMVDTIEANSGPPKPLSMLPLIDIGGPLAPDAIPLHVGGFIDALPSLVTLDYGIVSEAATDPTIGEIQNNLETQLLPKIVTARGRLATILGVADYTFTITPEMQGNSGADSIVLDRTDFSVFLAVAYAAEAALHIFCARDLDFSPISIAGVEDALNQTSTFLDLKPAGVGANHMSTAKARIISAKDALIDAADYLIAEIGTNQTHELIEIPSGGAADLTQFKDTLNYYYDYLVNPKDIDVRINDKDTVLTVDLKMFFDNPMGNPKDKLPDYTLTLEEIDSDVGVCFTWDANSFAEWTWPDATFNGLLPGMSGIHLKDLIYGDGTDWQKSICDTIHF